MPKRVGASSRSKIPADVLAKLNAGTLASATLAEGLAIDFQQLLRASVPSLTDDHIRLIDPSLGITRRMQLVGKILHEQYDLSIAKTLSSHVSDTVRGWAAYVIAHDPKMTISARLKSIMPLADDEHFGVREWAWLALRPRIAKEIITVIPLLEKWVHSPSERIRRFACEATRPRGVWCEHISALTSQPDLALPLLTPLTADPAKYVQDSVANWLNDAGKTQPNWVRAICQCWLEQSDSQHTARICSRALRNLK